MQRPNSLSHPGPAKTADSVTSKTIEYHPKHIRYTPFYNRLRCLLENIVFHSIPRLNWCCLDPCFSHEPYCKILTKILRHDSCFEQNVIRVPLPPTIMVGPSASVFIKSLRQITNFIMYIFKIKANRLNVQKPT
jgi:hypothetical protein